MNPKEEADFIINLYTDCIDDHLTCGGRMMGLGNTAKQCALIAVKYALNNTEDYMSGHLKQVEQEIIKM